MAVFVRLELQLEFCGLWQAGFSISAGSCKNSTLASWIVAAGLGSFVSFWYNSCCYAVLLHHLLRD